MGNRSYFTILWTMLLMANASQAWAQLGAAFGLRMG